jgi:hypothetical protein
MTLGQQSGESSITSPVESNSAGIYQVLTSPSNASMAQQCAGRPLPGRIVSDNGYRAVSR